MTDREMALGTVLGTDTRTGKAVALSTEGRRQGTYVAGINGTGKSTLLLNVALADIAAGDGLCLLDPHGDLVKEVLERVPAHRVKDVILFDPADVDHPFGLNPFDCTDKEREDPKVVDRICSEVVLTLKKLFPDSWGPRLEDLLRNSILTLMVSPECTLLDMLLLLTDQNARDAYTARVSDPVVSMYWRFSFPQQGSKRGSKDQTEHVGSTLNKIGRFLTNPVIRNIIAQPKSTFNFRTLMDDGKILLVNLSKGELGEDNSSLLGSVLVGKILIAALSRANKPAAERRPFHLIVDEYHSFATESFPTLQSEARKFGLDTMVAHQYRDQLDDLNRGSTLNVGNFILFRVTGRDAVELSMQFNNSPPVPEDVLKSVPYRAGRPGVYRAAGDQVAVKGTSRTYNDVANESANYLANTPNYHAYCKLIKGVELPEHQIRTSPCELRPSAAVRKTIEERSQGMAKSRADVEAYIASRFATMTDSDDTSPGSTGASPGTNGNKPKESGVTYEGDKRVP